MKREELRAIKNLLEYGEVKLLAKANGIKPKRAYALLQGRLKILDSDEGFVMACFDRCLPRKRRIEKLKQIAA